MQQHTIGDTKTMKRLSFAIAAAAAVALPAFSSFTPSAEDAAKFAAGQPVTNDQKTAEFKKFGKIKAKEAVVTDITDNVLKKGENVWSEDTLGDEDPVDGIWGYKIKRLNAYSDITSWYMIENGGQEYWATNTSDTVNSDGYTYIGNLRDGNVSNVPFQEGTNKNGRVVYNADGSVRTTSPKLMLPVTNQCYKTEKGFDIFASRKWVRALIIKATGKTEAEVDALIQALDD